MTVAFHGIGSATRLPRIRLPLLLLLLLALLLVGSAAVRAPRQHGPPARPHPEEGISSRPAVAMDEGRRHRSRRTALVATATVATTTTRRLHDHPAPPDATVPLPPPRHTRALEGRRRLDTEATTTHHTTPQSETTVSTTTTARKPPVPRVPKKTRAFERNLLLLQNYSEQEPPVPPVLPVETTRASDERNASLQSETTLKAATKKPPVPLPKKTRAFERSLLQSSSETTTTEVVATIKPPVPLPLKTRAFERSLLQSSETTTEVAAARKPPVPLPLKTRAFERSLLQSERVPPVPPLPVETLPSDERNALLQSEATVQVATRKPPVPLPLEIRAFERSLLQSSETMTEEATRKPPVPLPLKTRAFERYLKEEEDKEQPLALHPHRHRRLGQDKTVVAPTPAPLGKAPMTLPPATLPPASRAPKTASPATLAPALAVPPPPPPPTSSSPVKLSSSTAAPVEATRVPFAAPIVITTTGAPAASPTTAPAAAAGPAVTATAETVELSPFDVVVAASVTTTATAMEQEEQLVDYRKQVRTSLQMYLTSALPYDNLVYVQLRVVPSRDQGQRRRRRQQLRGLQQQSVNNSTMTSDIIINQLYSYAGEAVFKNQAPDSADVLLKQEELLTDTAAVQDAVDQSLQGVVTVQSTEVWTNDTDNGSDVVAPGSGKSKDIGTTTIITGSLVAGAVILALVLGWIILRRVRGKRNHSPPPPPAIITATRMQQKHAPVFSPYGKEEDDMNDADHIVADLEILEEQGSWHGSAASPSRPYLQLTTTGTTSAEGDDSPREDDSIYTTTRAGAAAEGIPDDDDEQNGTSKKRQEDDDVDRKLMVNGTAAKIVSIAKVPEEKKEETAAKPSLYASPVIAMSGSNDSMDGYSMYSGFYGSVAKSDGLEARRGGFQQQQQQDRSPAAKPSWMVAPKITPLGQATEEYSSDSESQFCYENAGVTSNAALTTLGPTLNSMSMDSADASSTSADDELMMLNLKNNTCAIVADSPSFPKPQPNHHYYSRDDNTPVMANSRSSLLQYSASVPAAPNGRDELSDEVEDDDEDPLRMAILSARESYSNNESAALYNSASSGELTPKMATKSSMPSSTSSIDGDRVDDDESQPSDEMMMEDSMAQDLEGFAEELERIKRDIGLSAIRKANPHTAVMTNTPVTDPLLMRAPFDEFGATTVTPDDNSRTVSNNGRRRR